MTKQIVGQSMDKHSESADRSIAPGEYADCIDTAVNLLTSITEAACEHESDLDLMRLINFMDLYRTYLASSKSSDGGLEFQSVVSLPRPAVLEARLGSIPLVSFEHFIGDSRLLTLAAAIATSESGERVAVPAPLQISANVNLDPIQ